MAGKKDFHSFYADYTFENIRSSDKIFWKEATNDFVFDPTESRVEKYLIWLLQNINILPKNLDAILDDYFHFNGEGKTLEGRISVVKERGSCRSLSKFLKGEVQKPTIKNLNFLAAIFFLPYPSFADFCQAILSESLVFTDLVEQDVKEENTPETKITRENETAIKANIQTESQNYSAQENIMPKKRFGFHAGILTAIAFFVISTGVYQIFALQNERDIVHKEKSQLAAQKAEIEPLLYSVKRVKSEFNARVMKIEMTNAPEKHESIQNFNTELILNEIYNQSFIHNNKSWSLPFDVKGEDRSARTFSPESFPLKSNIQIVNQPVIAAGKMTLRMNLFNNGNQTLYISGFELRVIPPALALHTDSIVAGKWFAAADRVCKEDIFEAKLTEGKTLYTFTLNQVPLQAQTPYFFAFDVHVDDGKKQLYAYEIYAKLTDGRGNRSEIRCQKSRFWIADFK